MINTSRGLDITTLKAGDRVRRLNSDSAWFKEGDVCTVQIDSEGALCVLTPHNNLSYSIGNFSESWELLTATTEKPVQINIKNIPMLLDYLKQHSIIANFNYDTHVLECDALYYDTVACRSFVEVEEVSPSLRSVREWLGY